MNNTAENKNIQALCKGDPKAFEVFFLYYYPQLVSFLTGFIKDNEIARDMAQDIFLSIWKNKEKLGDIQSFKAYLFKMGKNSICNFYDHSLVNEKYVNELLAQPVGFEDAEELIFANQLQSLIDVAVNQMPAQRKTIYLMSRVEGFSNKEISEKLNISKRTVENHLTLALSDIRKIIKACVILFF